MQPDSDILIIGGGPVGVCAARLLAGAGLQVTIAALAPPETHDPASTSEQEACADPRVYALSPATESLLRTAGVWSEALDPCPYQSMEVWDKNGVERIAFTGEDAGFAQLGHIVHHNKLMALLWSGLEDNPNLRVLKDDSLTAFKQGTKTIHVEFASGIKLETRLIIGADGANSKTRKLARLPTRQWSYNQTATVVTADLVSAHHAVARQVFTEHGALGILPVGKINPGRVVLIWSAQQSLAQTLAKADDNLFRRLLAQALEIEPKKITALWTRQQFPLTHCHAKTWVAPGLVLVGDAAHNIHPLAGQGLNLGFGDVTTLTALIEKGMKRAAGERLTGFNNMALLKRYQYQRMVHCYSMIALTDSINFLFQKQNLGAVVLRNRLMGLVQQFDTLKSCMVRLAPEAKSIKLSNQ